MTTPWELSNLLACLPMGMTALNLLSWSRGRLVQPPPLSVSVLVPVRDEAETIEQCVRAVMASDVPIRELIVYDDQSRDGTGDILHDLSQTFPQMKVLHGGALPAGWIGKPHACHRLAQQASGEVLLFVDADTVLQPSGIRRLLSLLQPAGGRGADIVTAVPRQLMQSRIEQWMMPLLVLTYTSWFPLWLVGNSRNPRFLAANGQLLMIRRAAYERFGGFKAVRNEIVDDMALCRLVKKSGGRVVFADGFKMAHCRMYGSVGALLQGFSKNIYEGIGENPFSLLLIIALHGCAFIWPYLALLLVALAALPYAMWPALCGVAANWLTRLALALRFDHPLSSVLWHPVSVLMLIGMALNSYRLSAQNRIVWRGRTYAARHNRALT